MLFDGKDPEVCTDIVGIPQLNDDIFARLILFGDATHWEHYIHMGSYGLSFECKDFFEQISELWHQRNIEMQNNCMYPYLFQYLRTRFITLQTHTSAFTMLSES